MLDSSHEVLSKEEEYELAVAMKGGCSKSREKLITHNIRLVHKVANKFVTPVEHDDLVMAGIQGLIKCLDTFEPEKGFKLSTYAHSQIFWAIKHSLAKALTTMMKSSTRMAGTAMTTKSTTIKSRYYTMSLPC